MLSFFVHPTTAELDNFVLLQHVASGMFAEVRTVVLVTASRVFHDMVLVMLMAVVVGGFPVRDDGCVFHTYLPLVLPFWAIPSARRDAELTEPPFL